MIPTGIASVLAFFFFVIPGFIVELLYNNLFPSKMDSPFREVSRVALLSLPFTTASCAIVCWFAYWMDRPVLLHLGFWIMNGRPYSAGSVTDAIVLSLLEVVLAGSLAVGVVWLWYKINPSKRNVRPQSSWTVALTAPKGFVNLATVTLADGTRYQGQVDSFSKEIKWNNREIILIQPITVIRNQEASHIWEEAVTLHASNIVSVTALLITNELADDLRKDVRKRLLGNEQATLF